MVEEEKRRRAGRRKMSSSRMEEARSQPIPSAGILRGTKGEEGRAELRRTQEQKTPSHRASMLREKNTLR